MLRAEAADKEGEEKEGAGGPKEGAEPVREDEAVDGGGVVGAAEAVVQRNLEEAGRGPEQKDEDGGGGSLGGGLEDGAEGVVQRKECGGEFEEHGRADDEAGEVAVALSVEREAVRGELGKERVVDDLDEPDEAGHEEGRGELEEEEIEAKHGERYVGQVQLCFVGDAVERQGELR